MHKPDSEGGKPMGERHLGWDRNEYEVLDMEQVYCAVSEHRRRCRLQPDLLLPPAPRSARDE